MQEQEQHTQTRSSDNTDTHTDQTHAQGAFKKRISHTATFTAMKYTLGLRDKLHNLKESIRSCVSSIKTRRANDCLGANNVGERRRPCLRHMCPKKNVWIMTRETTEAERSKALYGVIANLRLLNLSSELNMMCSRRPANSVNGAHTVSTDKTTNFVCHYASKVEPNARHKANQHRLTLQPKRRHPEAPAASPPPS